VGLAAGAARPPAVATTAGTPSVAAAADPSATDADHPAPQPRPTAGTPSRAYGRAWTGRPDPVRPAPPDLPGADSGPGRRGGRRSRLGRAVDVAVRPARHDRARLCLADLRRRGRGLAGRARPGPVR